MSSTLTTNSDIQILLIEDNENDYFVFKRCLERIYGQDFSLHWAQSLASACVSLKDNTPSLIILDLGLPDASGKKSIETLCQICPEKPIIVLTGCDEFHLLEQSVENGVSDFLVKGEFSTSQLQRSIFHSIYRKKLELEKSELEKQLLQSQKMEALGQLTGGIAHDFNNKLAIIRGNVEVIPHLIAKGESIEPFIDKIIKAVKTSSGLTRKLLTFGRQQESYFTEVDLSEQIELSTQLLRGSLGDDIHLEIEIESHLPKIQADETQLDQILMNLIINARDAMQSKGHIQVKLESARIFERRIYGQTELMPGDYICLSIKDNGSGMTQETLERLFEPYYSTKEKDKGTGLGLSVVYGIVTHHQATICVESQLGQGTTFSIFFKNPVALTATSPLELSTASVTAITKQKTTLLYAEDDESLQKINCDFLTEAGYHVIPAKNGKEALEVFNTQPQGSIDLVIADIIMPHVSGYDMLEVIRKKSSFIPFIFVSGLVDKNLPRKGQLPVNVAFIDKPYLAKELLETIKKLTSARATSEAA